MNILILSVGTRNKVVQYFRDTVKGEGKVVATDMSELAPAVYEADKFYKVPRMTDEGYIDVIFDICKKEPPRSSAQRPLSYQNSSIITSGMGDLSGFFGSVGSENSRVRAGGCSRGGRL